MYKESFIEQYQSSWWKLLAKKLSVAVDRVCESRLQRKPIVIRHRNTGLPLRSVALGTLIGADLEGADLMSADLHGSIYGVLLFILPMLPPMLFALPQIHLPKIVKDILISAAVVVLMNRLVKCEVPPLGFDLHDANLRNALLIGADLRGAILDRADLRGANLFAAQIRGTSFKRVLFDETTIWPAGFRPPRRKHRNYDPPTPGI